MLDVKSLQKDTVSTAIIATFRTLNDQQTHFIQTFEYTPPYASQVQHIPPYISLTWILCLYMPAIRY